MNNFNYNPFKDNYKNYNQFRQDYIPNQGISSQNIENEDTDYYAENVLNLNKGKNIKVYMSFSDSIEWRDRIFEGTLEAWGKDFMLIKKSTNQWYMLWNIYIDYIEFNEPVIF